MKRSILTAGVLLAFITLLAYSNIPRTVDAKVLHTLGFESGNKYDGVHVNSTNENTCCYYSYLVFNSMSAISAREGSRMARFELRYDDPKPVAGSKRAELSLTKMIPTLGKVRGNTEWYGFSIFLPSEYGIDQAAEVLAQIQAIPDSGEVHRSPPLGWYSSVGYWEIAAHTSDVKIQTENGTRTNLWRRQQKFGVWTDFVVEVKWDYRKQGAGMTNIWIREGGDKPWEQIVAYRGPTGYDDTNNFYFKSGVYKWPWLNCEPGDVVTECGTNGTPRPSTQTKRVMYFDAFRAGDNTASFEQVAPKPTGKKPTLKK